MPFGGPLPRMARADAIVPPLTPPFIFVTLEISKCICLFLLSSPLLFSPSLLPFSPPELPSPPLLKKDTKHLTLSQLTAYVFLTCEVTKNVPRSLGTQSMPQQFTINAPVRRASTSYASTSLRIHGNSPVMSQ